MENKINIAAILKDCPPGMELDCTMWDNVVLAHVDINYKYPIWIKKMEGEIEVLTEYGCFNFDCSAKCVIYPKGKTTWDGFVPPCEFKDGDIVATSSGDWIGITTGGKSGKFMPTYCVITGCGEFEVYLNKKETWQFHRLATEEEKTKLFQTIKDNGYKWNTETKTLDKLIKPKFKVGDRVRHKTTNKDDIYEISKVYDDSYGLVGFTWMLYMKYQDQYELIPSKFDINTLKPFDEVLVRSHNSDVWECDFFSLYNPKCSNRFHCIGAWYNICIPYIGNEHLRGTTNDCDEFYKNWE